MRFHCLAIVAPEWLLEHSQPGWVDRYGVRLEDSQLPSGEEERQVWAEPVGQDGSTLSILAMSMPRGSHRSQQDYEIDLVGPTRADYKWQAKPQTGFDAGQFQIDWQAKQATCPEGCMSSSWTPAIDNRKNEVIKIKFSTKDCQCCPSLALCTQSTHQRRTITVRPEQHYQALQQARERAKTDDFKTLYARRAGVEGTLSEASSRHGSASFSLYRPRKDASPASCHGCCYECRSHGSLARW